MRRLSVAAIAVVIMAMSVTDSATYADEAQPDLVIDIADAGGFCKNYKVDEPYFTGEYWDGLIPAETWAKESQFRIGPLACWTLCSEMDCYLDGDLIVVWTADAPKSTTWYQIDGMRRAAAIVRVINQGQFISTDAGYLSLANGGWDAVVENVSPGYSVRVDVMQCPDVDGNGHIDLFTDILETANDFGCGKPWQGPGCLGPQTDHNEDGVVDLFNDTFIAADRFGLNCKGWLAQFD